MTAYYNEIDAFAADWLRELIKAGLIAPGIVDTRSIEDVVATDLVGFSQCHWFAGIGVWSYALRRAGWPDDRPVWTGSCPCPPFSVAGKKKPCPECGGGKPLPHAFRTGVFRCTACGHDWYADGRHLWPEFYRLIGEYRPGTVFGEQVAGRDGLAWGDVVQATLELEGYAVGRVPFASCGVGAPHIRQRLYWVAHASCEQHDRNRGERTGGWLQPAKRGEHGRLADTMPTGRPEGRAGPGCGQASGGGGSGGVGDAGGAGLQERKRDGRVQCRTMGTDARETTIGTGDSRGLVHAADIHCEKRSEAGGLGSPKPSVIQETRERNGQANRVASTACGLEHPGGRGWERRQETAPGHEHDGEASERAQGQYGAGLSSAHRLSERHGPGPTNGFWRDADWLFCRDEFWRPVEPGTFPLAYGTPARVGRLRGYGNAINAAQAEEFIRAFMRLQEHSHV